MAAALHVRVCKGERRERQVEAERRARQLETRLKASRALPAKSGVRRSPCSVGSSGRRGGSRTHPLAHHPACRQLAQIAFEL